MFTADNNTTDSEPGHVAGQHEYEGIRYLPITPRSHLENIKKLPLTSADLLLATFSKSGTTWLQEISYLISNGADMEEARSRPLVERVPFLDWERNYEKIVSMKRPRILKTHLRPSFFRHQILDNKVKVVVMMRNPKDVLCSFYNFYRSCEIFGPFAGSWHDFFELVKRRRLIYGDWFDHVLDWWSLRDERNVLFLKYEEMLVRPRENIAKLARFMQRELTEDQMTDIVEATSFKAMKNNSSIRFDAMTMVGKDMLRSGTIGNWKNYFTVAQNEYFDALYEQRMKDSGLDFVFELSE